MASTLISLVSLGKSKDWVPFPLVLAVWRCSVLLASGEMTVPVHFGLSSWPGVWAARQTGHTELCHSLSSNICYPHHMMGCDRTHLTCSLQWKIHRRYHLETQQAVLMHCAEECKIAGLVYGCVHSRWMTSNLCPKLKSIYTPNNLKCTNVQCEYLHVRSNSISCPGEVWDWHVHFVSKITEVLFAYANFSREKNLLGKLEYLLTTSQSSLYLFL